MPIFLDTTGQPSIAIAVCDRCKMKRYFSSLGPDQNFPGLRVCDLRFPRPDVSVADTNQYLVNDASGDYLISTEQNIQTPENNGNIDTIEP